MLSPLTGALDNICSILVLSKVGEPGFILVEGENGQVQEYESKIKVGCHEGVPGEPMNLRIPSFAHLFRIATVTQMASNPSPCRGV